MWWTRYLSGIDRREPVPWLQSADDELRVFPIVGRDVCYPVAALLARGKVEEAGELVSPRAWVASAPLYG
jgi:hypothetical protein